MKRFGTLLLQVTFALLYTIGYADPASLMQKATAMAEEAGMELGLTEKEKAALKQLFFEKLNHTEQRTRHITDTAERSQLIKQIHQEFTKKLYNTYNRKTSSKIEGWYYNYTNKQ